MNTHFSPVAGECTELHSNEGKQPVQEFCTHTAVVLHTFSALVNYGDAQHSDQALY